MELIYHAHVYFDKSTIEVAQFLRKRIEEDFSLEIGKFHEKPVGPHPSWSYQIKFTEADFGQLIPWLMHNRQNLTVFIHSCSGEDLRDHTASVCWLGQSQPLNLEIFN